MSQLLSLGAINKLTGEYVYPGIANKTDEYLCPECNKDLILCQGEIRTHHFRHKVDSVNPCHHYSSPGESQIHKDAKLLLNTLLEQKTRISLVRSCYFCKKTDEFEIPETSETSVIKMEYRFEFNGPKVADVAYIDNDEIVCIFEICNTHKTSSENRPEPWFEIDAETLIRTANYNKLSSLQIPCIRSEKCEECVIIEGEAYLKTYFENIQKNKYKFITQQVSIFHSMFPDTTKMIACETYDTDISICSDIIVDCENNFTIDEKNVIDKFNINNIEDLIRNDKISKNDKQRCLKCFAYVRERYELMGIEPFNGHNVIQLEKYTICIRILPNGIIKYCKSLGEQNTNNFAIIGMK